MRRRPAMFLPGIGTMSELGWPHTGESVEKLGCFQAFEYLIEILCEIGLAKNNKKRKRVLR